MGLETLQKYRISAVEPFGVVMHSIPILIAGIELLLEKATLAIKKRECVNNLSYHLLMQQRIVKEIIWSIIKHSSPDIDETLLEKDVVACFRDRNIQAKVEKFLKPENYQALAGNLRLIQKILEEVAGHLVGFIPSHKDNPNDLLGIIEANKTAREHRPDIIARFKVAFESDDVKQRIEELEKTTATCLAFSQLVIANRQVSAKSQQPPKAVKLAKAFRRIQNSSKNLYAAFSRCCIGTCHNEHDLHVLLEDRFDLASKSPGLFYKDQMNEDNEAVLAFQLIFGAKAVTPTQTRYHELSVRCIEEDESVGSPHELGSKLSRVTFSEPEYVASKDAGFVPVPDFCTAIATAHGGAQHVTFILHTSKGMGTVTAEKKTIKEKDACQTITLQDFISASKETTLPWKSRMMLASKVASSLLQFSQTRWHSQALSKGSIFFLLHPNSSDAAPLADFERPFVRAKIGGEEVSGEGNVEPRSILLELGILLLEIWYQTGLEDRFNDRTSHTSASFHSRLNLAVQWLDDEYSLPLELYEDAVRFCIRGASDKCWTDWNSMELWNEICKEVIEPLSNFCRQRLTGRVSNGN